MPLITVRVLLTYIKSKTESVLSNLCDTSANNIKPPVSKVHNVLTEL